MCSQTSQHFNISTLKSFNLSRFSPFQGFNLENFQHFKISRFQHWQPQYFNVEIKFQTCQMFQHYLMHNFQGCQEFNLEVTFRLPQSACRGGGCRGLQAPQEPAAPSRGMQASLCPPCPPGAWAGVLTGASGMGAGSSPP